MAGNAPGDQPGDDDDDCDWTLGNDSHDKCSNGYGLRLRYPGNSPIRDAIGKMNRSCMAIICNNGYWYPGWQELRERANGVRRKLWTRTKFLSPS